jgi:hypothetical protein
MLCRPGGCANVPEVHVLGPVAMQGQVDLPRTFPLGPSPEAMLRGHPEPNGPAARDTEKF